MGIIFCENTQALFHQITFGELVTLYVFSNCVLNIAFKKVLPNCFHNNTYKGNQRIMKRRFK